MPALRIRKVTRKRTNKPDVIEYVCTFSKEIAEQLNLAGVTLDVHVSDRNHVVLTRNSAATKVLPYEQLPLFD